MARFVTYFGFKNMMVMPTEEVGTTFSLPALVAKPEWRLGLVRGFRYGNYYDYNLKLLLGEERIVGFQTQEQLFDALRNGDVEAILAPSIHYYFYLDDEERRRFTLVNASPAPPTPSGLALTRATFSAAQVDNWLRLIETMRLDGTLHRLGRAAYSEGSGSNHGRILRQARAMPIPASLQESNRMSAISQRSRRALEVPLHLLATLGVTTLLVLVIAAFAWQTYRGAQDILLQTSIETTRYIRDTLNEKVQRILSPARNQITLLAHSAFSSADTLAHRLEQLPLIVDALNENPITDALYVGYPNGEFILFRPLRNDAVSRAVKARVGASLLVQSISQDAVGTMIGRIPLL